MKLLLPLGLLKLSLSCPLKPLPPLLPSPNPPVLGLLLELATISSIISVATVI